MKFSRTPYSFHSTVTVALAPPCTTGKGYSPPARKLACLPLLATRFGSANICSSPCVLSASTNAARFRSGRKAKMFSASLIVNFVSVFEIVSACGGENWPVVVRPMVFSAPIEATIVEEVKPPPPPPQVIEMPPPPKFAPPPPVYAPPPEVPVQVVAPPRAAITTDATAAPDSPAPVAVPAADTAWDSFAQGSFDGQSFIVVGERQRELHLRYVERFKQCPCQEVR